MPGILFPAVNIMSLYNLERPTSFSEVIGQDKIVQIISRDLVKGTPKQSYLFTGVRGTGKTSMARILAQSFNCKHPKEDGSPCGTCASCMEVKNNSSMDVYELDAASNNSVENIRDILENIQYKPIYNKKVFILDECHMLSNAASNALLKVLEEPPADVVFILCTTEAHKVLPTIISRCSRYDFEKISQAEISNHLRNVCVKHKVSYEESALDIIAKAANGGMRDALSILDKFMSEGEIRAAVVSDVLGVTPSEAVFGVLKSIAWQDAAVAVAIIRNHLNRGVNISFFIQEILNVLLDVTDFQSSGSADSIVGDLSYRESVIDLSYLISTAKAFEIMDEFQSAYQRKSDEFCLITAVLASVQKECQLDILSNEVERLKEKMTLLERSLNSSLVVSSVDADAECRIPKPQETPAEPAFSNTSEDACPVNNTESNNHEAYEDDAFDYEEDNVFLDEQSAVSTISDEDSLGVSLNIPDSVSEGSPDVPVSQEDDPDVPVSSEDDFIHTGMSFSELADVMARSEETISSSLNEPTTADKEDAPEEMTGALARLWNFFD